MIEHEDHCPEKGDRRCDCDYEARVRADERQRIAQAIEALPTWVIGDKATLAVDRFDAARIAWNGGAVMTDLRCVVCDSRAEYLIEGTSYCQTHARIARAGGSDE